MNDTHSVAAVGGSAEMFAAAVDVSGHKLACQP